MQVKPTSYKIKAIIQLQIRRYRYSCWYAAASLRGPKVTEWKSLKSIWKF